jgi:MYXO-CTERM domain-containing protein
MRSPLILQHLTLAAALAGAGPAIAAPYFWSYGTGCALRDFSRNCWAATAGGPGGVLLPLTGASLEVNIRQGGDVSLPVNFANPGTGRDQSITSLWVDGSGAAPAALLVARNTLQTQTAVVGDSGRGRLDVTGGRFEVSGLLEVGKLSGSVGHIELSNGQIRSDNAALGRLPDSSGSVTLSGAASQWVSRGLIIGMEGLGQLNITQGAVFTGGDAVLGRVLRGEGEATVSGAGSRLDLSSTLLVGERGRGHLTLSNGAVLSSSGSNLGFYSGSRGTVVLSGAGTRWDNAGTIRIGSGAPGPQGTGLLHIGSGATVNTNSIVLGQGSLLLDGGTLRTVGFERSSAGFFNWTTGTLNIAQIATLGSNGLDSVIALTPGRHLVVESRLELPQGTALILAGGSLVAEELELRGATVSGAAGAVLQLPVLRGHGSVTTAVRSDATLVAEGGNLTLGDLGRSDGVVLAGQLNVQAERTLLLLDADAAELGRLSVLAGGSRLVSLNGIALAPGERLTSLDEAAARVEGLFHNDGAVQAGGRISFDGAVGGAGSFSGPISFLERYSVGGDQGVAEVDFTGAQLQFPAGSTLSFELLAATGHDRMLHIDSLEFNGRLELVFSFQPAAGTRFSLLDFESFSGQLTPDHIDVLGFDRDRLDFSRLAIDGTLGVSAVPEPLGWALWLAGLAGLGAWSRRRGWRGQQRTPALPRGQA